MRAIRTFVAFSVCAVLAAGGASIADGPELNVGPWRAGLHYKLLPPRTTPDAPADKVLVNEAFWYGCGHCFALDPVLEAWDAQNAAYIEFVRVPVIWGPMHHQHAKLFYTLQALDRPELHAAVFDAIHKEHQPLADPDEIKAREMHFRFLSSHGITRERFDAAYDSMPVLTAVRRAAAFTRDHQVANVPTIFIAGKFSTGVSEAGGPEKLIALIDDLAANEKGR
jgi:thiol:disulfide interchange protein DsbA